MGANTKSSTIELATVIKDLRTQLIEARNAGGDEALRFTVEEVELELNVVVEEQVGADIKAQFFVLTSQAKGDKKDIRTQKMKIKLKPYEKVIKESGEEEKSSLDVGCMIKKKDN